MKTDKKSKLSRSFGNLSKFSSKTHSEDKDSATGEDKSPGKSSKRSIKLMKIQSMRLKHDDCQDETNSDGNNSGKAKNNFYKVLDKIR